MTPEIAAGIRRVAKNLGIDPSDLGTSISYETGGKFDPNMYGGAGGKHLGLIQFGPTEQQKYGVTPNMPIDQHFGAVENYLRDRGVKPGMGMLDLYSTINAGRPGRYDASDANNGGAPGTVADKVASMVAHRAKANALLGNNPEDPNAPTPVPAPATPPAAAPAAPAPMDITSPAQQAGVAAAAAPAAPGGGFDAAALQKLLGQGQQQQQEQDTPPPPINIAQPAGLPVAQRLAQVMQSLNQRQG